MMHSGGAHSAAAFMWASMQGPLGSCYSAAQTKFLVGLWPHGCHNCRQGHVASQGVDKIWPSSPLLRTGALLSASPLCAHGCAARRLQSQVFCSALARRALFAHYSIHPFLFWERSAAADQGWLPAETGQRTGRVLVWGVLDVGRLQEPRAVFPLIARALHEIGLQLISL